MANLGKNKLVLLGFFVVLLAVIPLTVYLLQKQQQTRSQAAPTTKLSFTPSSSQASPIAKTVNDQIPLDIMLDPGQNVVSYAKLVIKYDPSKLATSSAGTSCSDSFCVSANTLSLSGQGPSYSTGTVVVVMSTPEPTKFIQTPTKIGTINFKVIASTGATPTQISFDSSLNQTLILSANKATDQQEENVLSQATPAFILAADIPVTPSVTPTPTLTSLNQPPVCTSLTVDKPASPGTLPYTFTATGNDPNPNGAISKVTFNFGDGTVQDASTSAQATVSARLAHIYNTAGSFNASAIMTNNNGATSSITASCTQTITVGTSGGIGQPTNPTPTTIAFVPTAVPTAVPTNTQAVVYRPPISPPGPGDIFVGIGLLGTLLAGLGGLLFFIL